MGKRMGERSHARATQFKIQPFESPQSYSAGLSSLVAVSPASVAAGTAAAAELGVESSAEFSGAVELLLLVLVSSSSFFSSSDTVASALSSFAPFSVASDDSYTK